MDNINFNPITGQYSFYSRKEVPWHGKGQISDSTDTSETVLEKSGLNFHVGKAAIIYRIPEVGDIESSTQYFTYRKDTNQILGTDLGKDYTPIQNKDAFRFLDSIAGKNGVTYETAGALGNGEAVFVTVKLPHYIKIGNDDVIENYLFIHTRHDGKGSACIALTPTRIVCNNTLNAALANCTHTVRIRHVENALDKLDEAPKIMGMIDKTAPVLEQVFNNWAKVRVTDAQVRKLIMLAMTDNPEIIGNVKAERWDEISAKYKNITTEAFHYGMVADSQQLDSTKGTLFGVYNTITGYYQNVKDFTNEEERTKAILLGGTAQNTDRAPLTCV